MKVDETVRAVWSPRVGEAAAAKMLQAQRARLVQLGSCVVLVVWGLTRLPYVTMRSPQAFDKYIGSIPSRLIS